MGKSKGGEGDIFEGGGTNPGGNYETVQIKHSYTLLSLCVLYFTESKCLLKFQKLSEEILTPYVNINLQQGSFLKRVPLIKKTFTL